MGFTRDETSKAKGIAIILLLFHHCFVSPGRYANYTILFPLFPEAIVNRLATMARICVAIFTFLSAYGMTISYKKKQPGNSTRTGNKTVSNEKVSFGKESGIRTVFKEYRHRLVSLIGNFFFIYVLIVFWGTFVVKDGRIQTYGTGIRKILNMLIDALGLAGIAHTPTYLFTWWYESLAIVVILILPVLIWIYLRCHIWMLFAISLFVAVVIPVDNTSPYETLQISNYLFCISFGIAAADRNWIVKIGNIGKSAGIKILKFFLELAGIAVVLQLNIKISGSILQPVTEGLGAFLIICLCYEFLGRIPLIGRGLRFLGVYSGSIYLIHNMIRGVWYEDFTYSFRYPALIVAVLLSISLLLSVIIAKVQKLLRYDKLLRRLR